MDYNSRNKHGSLGHSKESVQVSRAEEWRSGGRGGGAHTDTLAFICVVGNHTEQQQCAGGVQSKVLKPYTPLRDGPGCECVNAARFLRVFFLGPATVVSSYYLIEKHPRAQTHARTHINFSWSKRRKKPAIERSPQ